MLNILFIQCLCVAQVLPALQVGLQVPLREPVIHEPEDLVQRRDSPRRGYRALPGVSSTGG